MSVFLVNKVFSNFPRGGPPLNVFMAIAEAANEQGNCQLSRIALAAAARTSDVTVWRSSKRLVREGWIVTDVKVGRGNAVIYQINLRKLLNSRRDAYVVKKYPTPEAATEALLQRVGLARVAASERPVDTYAD